MAAEEGHIRRASVMTALLTDGDVCSSSSSRRRRTEKDSKRRGEMEDGTAAGAWRGGRSWQQRSEEGAAARSSTVNLWLTDLRGEEVRGRLEWIRAWNSSASRVLPICRTAERAMGGAPPYESAPWSSGRNCRATGGRGRGGSPWISPAARGARKGTYIGI